MILLVLSISMLLRRFSGEAGVNEEFDRIPPKFRTPISSQFLGELASQITAKNMMTIAIRWLDLSFSDEEKANYESHRKSFFFTLTLLDLYAKKTSSNLEVDLVVYINTLIVD